MLPLSPTSTPRLKQKSLQKRFFGSYLLERYALLLRNRLKNLSTYLILKTNCVGTLNVMKCVFKEVIQPQVPLRLPCYDFTPVMNHTVANVPPKVRLSASGATHSHGVTGGVYKARERIHRDMLIRDY